MCDKGDGSGETFTADIRAVAKIERFLSQKINISTLSSCHLEHHVHASKTSAVIYSLVVKCCYSFQLQDCFTGKRYFFVCRNILQGKQFANKFLYIRMEILQICEGFLCVVWKICLLYVVPFDCKWERDEELWIVQRNDENSKSSSSAWLLKFMHISFCRISLIYENIRIT